MREKRKEKKKVFRFSSVRAMNVGFLLLSLDSRFSRRWRFAARQDCWWIRDFGRENWGGEERMGIEGEKKSWGWEFSGGATGREGDFGHC